MTGQEGFGAWLKARMAERDLTQKQVADAIDVRQQTVSKYLNNDEIPRTERIEALASILRLSVFDVLDAVSAAIGGGPTPLLVDRAAQLERLRRVELEARRLRQQLGESDN